MFFFYFHFHFEIDFQATSGLLKSCFNELYVSDTRLLFKSWKQSNGQYDLASPLRLALMHNMAFFDTLFIFECISRLKVTNNWYSILASVVTVMHSFLLPANCTMFGVQNLLVSIKGTTSLNTIIVLVTCPHYTLDCH